MSIHSRTGLRGGAPAGWCKLSAAALGSPGGKPVRWLAPSNLF